MVIPQSLVYAYNYTLVYEIIGIYLDFSEQ